MLPIKSAKSIVSLTFVNEAGTTTTFAQEITIPIEGIVTRDELMPAVLSCIDAFAKALGSTPNAIRMANRYLDSE